MDNGIIVSMNNPETKPASIFEAVFSNNTTTLIKLLKDGASTNIRDGDGRTPLIHAAIDQNVPLVKMLITNGADVNLADFHNCTALHFAAQESSTQIASLLLKYGAQVDAQDTDGNTPLSNAVFSSKGHGELIELLLLCGANKELKNKYGVSPLDLAKSIANYDVTRFFATQV